MPHVCDLLALYQLNIFVKLSCLGRVLWDEPRAKRLMDALLTNRLAATAVGAYKQAMTLASLRTRPAGR